MFWRGKIRAYVADIMNNIAVCPKLPMEGQKLLTKFVRAGINLAKSCLLLVSL